MRIGISTITEPKTPQKISSISTEPRVKKS